MMALAVVHEARCEECDDCGTLITIVRVRRVNARRKSEGWHDRLEEHVCSGPREYAKKVAASVRDLFD